MALIDIRDLTFAYPGSYDNVFEHLSLQLDTHWRLGLVGRNGRRFRQDYPAQLYFHH